MFLTQTLTFKISSFLLFTAKGANSIAKVEGKSCLCQSVPGKKDKNYQFLKNSLKVVAKFAEAVDQPNDHHIDVGQLDQPNHEKATNPNESRPDGLNDRDFVLVETKLGLKKYKAYGAVACVRNCMGSENCDEDQDCGPSMPRPSLGYASQTQGLAIFCKVSLSESSLLLCHFHILLCEE